jgi:RNA recognition motif-containing protein
MNIYVGNLAWGVADEELRRAFEGYGQVTTATVIKDKATGKSRGFGFVEMPNSPEAQAAITGLNGADLKGRPITVNEARPAKPRENRPPRRMGSRGGSYNE